MLARPRSLAGPLLALVFAALALLAGQWLGGGWALGRRDAVLALPTLLAFVLLYGWTAEWLGVPHRRALAMGLAAMVALLAAGTLLAPTSGLAAGNWPDAAALLAGTLAAMVVAAFVRSRSAAWRSWVRAGLFLMLAALWWLAAHSALARLYAPYPPGASGRTVMLTGLPLRQWQAAAMAGPRDDPGLTSLSNRLGRQLELRDALAAGALGPGDQLLLAHPRALSPETLVEIDRFVRAGGKVLILADGLSGWPLPYRLGDPRNPPLTSLLTPLLDHWGIRLAAPLPDGPMAGEVSVKVDGQRLLLHSPGYFEALPPACRSRGFLANGVAVAADCRIGRGHAVLLADADLLFAPLWQPVPGWAEHLRPSGNLDWIAAALNGADAAPIWGLRPTWP